MQSSAGGRLVYLDISYNQLGALGMRKVGGALDGHGCLRTLDISGNAIGIEGADALADALAHNYSITKLNSAVNRLKHTGVLVLCNAFGPKQVVRDLDLGFNEAHQRGAESIARLLHVYPRLEALNLENNYMGPSGAESVLRALENNSTLRRLNLSNNRIGAGGARGVARVLQHSVTIEHVDVAANDVGDEGMSSLSRGMRQITTTGMRRALRSLVLDDVSVHVDTQVEFILSTTEGMLPELRMLDFGSLAFVRGHKNCQRFLRQPLTHSIRNAHELLATRLIERRNSMGLERSRWSVTQSGDLVRTPPPAARSDVDDDDAADALHLLIALPRTQCAEAQKGKFAAMMLESEGSIIKDVEVPTGIWVTTPLGRVLKGGVQITTAGCLWGCGRRRAHPKILVPKVNGWSGGGVFGADTRGANVLESLEKSLAMSSDASESEALLRNRTGELDAKGCNLMSWTPYGEAKYATSSNASESDQGLVDQMKVDANWLVAHRFGDWAEYFNRRTEATLCTFRGVAVADPKARIEWLDFTDKSHNTALQLAIKHGEIAIAERLIARNRSTECQVHAPSTVPGRRMLPRSFVVSAVPALLHMYIVHCTLYKVHECTRYNNVQ